MHRIEGADYVTIGGENFYTDGPPGTVVTASWLNAVQEEIAHVIEEGGGTLQTSATETRDQLITYLKVLFVEPTAVETLTNKTINSDSNTLTIDSSDANTTLAIDTGEALTSFTFDTGDPGTYLMVNSADTNTFLLFNTAYSSTYLTFDSGDGGTNFTIDSSDANTTLNIDNAQANTTINNASTTVAGVVEKSTSAENIAGSSDTVYPSVLGIRQAFNASGSAPVFACRAWVDFDGTGVVAINASGNVSSITDNGGNGDYTVNFTTALPASSYAIAMSLSNQNGGDVQCPKVRSAAALPGSTPTTKTTTQLRIAIGAGASTFDSEFVSVAVFL